MDASDVAGHRWITLATSNGITDPPDDDPQVMASRLARTEARLEALLTVVASKDLVSRQEVDQEQARDKPTRR